MKVETGSVSQLTSVTVVKSPQKQEKPINETSVASSDTVSISVEAMEKLQAEKRNGGGNEPPIRPMNGGGNEPPIRPMNGGGNEPPIRPMNGGGNEPPIRPMNGGGNEPPVRE